MEREIVTSNIVKCQVVEAFGGERKGYRKEEVFSGIDLTLLHIESFRVICPNLLIVRAWTDPDLLSLIIFYLFQWE